MSETPRTIGTLGVYTIGADAISARFRAEGAASAAKVTGVVEHYTYLLQTKIKAKASGRPGPNAPTGDYRRSIGVRFYGGQTDVQVLGGGWAFSGIVGTNKPQGRRLELGFHGQDSLGRVYNQPPFPHFGPAMDEIQPDMEAAMFATLAGLDAD